ncbi:MAG: hypothetical protein JWP87_741 [Labilithrix sp.]|nr:hypothetical protein [Labilithrix sp.]
MGKLHACCVLVVTVAGGAAFVGCSSDDASSNGSSGTSGTSGDPSSSGTSGSMTSGGTSGTMTSGGTSGGPPTNPDDGPVAGNPNGKCAVPAEAQAESIANPRTVVGTGTAASCTSDAFVAAVAKGGVITFDCGAAPTTITLTATAKVHNDTGPIVIDGGGKVTLSGGGKVRILYANACDPMNGGYASGVAGDCNEQVTPKLTLQNLTFVDGSVKLGNVEEGGGGALYVRGGRTKIVSSRFFHDACDDEGSDVGGGAIRVLDFPKNGSVDRPVFVVNSTFGGKVGYGNTCANGGALSSIGTSYSIYNSVFSDNHATGHGANSGNGGNGGAIYNDGNTIALNVCGTLMEDNHANEGGSAIFFVSNDSTGTITITDSTLKNNPKGTFETAGFPGLFVKAKGPPKVTNSTIQ